MVDTDAPTILVVEDNPANQQLTQAILEVAGYRVQIAETMDEAEESVTASPPDLILMDVRLPDGDGLELTRRLRARGSTAAVPIIVLTANAMASDRESALAAGCNAYISKPVDRAALLAAIRRQLGR